MKLRLTLDYTLPPGRLARYFDALQQGRAAAARCAVCDRVSFPPSITCADCGSSTFEWVSLSGQAQVMHRTDTPDAAFAMARFSGADNAALVRLSDPGKNGRRGHLIAPGDGAPGIWLELEEDDEDDVDIR